MLRQVRIDFRHFVDVKYQNIEGIEGIEGIVGIEGIEGIESIEGIEQWAFDTKISKYRDTTKYRYRTFAILRYIEYRTSTSVVESEW